MIKGNLDNIKSVELIKATSGLPYNTVSDVFVRVDNYFEFHAESVNDFGTNSQLNVQITEEQLELLADNFKVLEYILPKKEYKLQSVINALEHITEEYKKEVERLQTTNSDMEDKYIALQEKIADRLNEYQSRLDELSNEYSCDPLLDEAETVYCNLITLLEYLADEKYIKRVSK